MTPLSSRALSETIHVGFDASAALVPQPTGVAAAIQQTAMALNQRDDVRCTLYLKLSRFKRRRYLSGFGPIPHWWYAGPVFWVGRMQVFHGPDTRLPPRLPAHVKSVATIHDFSSLHPAGFSRSSFADTRRKHYEQAREADHIVVYSQAIAEEVQSRLSIPADRITTVGLAPALSQRDIRDDDQFSHPKPYLLLLGELSKRKATAEAIQAYIDARAKHAELKAVDLLVVGRPGFGSEAATALMQKQPAGVKYAGYLSKSQLASALSQAYALLFPSRYEGFGLPVLEAMTMGVPVIAGNCGALVELVGEAGVIVDPDDAEALGEALAEFAGSAEKRKDYGRRGRARSAGWSWQRTAANLRAVYAKLVD